MKTLIYCLDILKIKEGTEVYRKAVEVEYKVPIEFANEWISAMKIIANASLDYTFSQSQLSDFLTLAAKGIEQKKTSSEIIIFKMYRDIIENYDKFSNSLKSNYPEVIVDVISVINQGIDTKGNKINTIGLDKYYQSRKQQATSKVKEEPLTQAAPIRTTTAAGIYNEKIPELRNDFVESLCKITKRKRHDLEQSLATLQESDLKKISDLCRNYNKLQYYYKKLIAKEEFKNEIQKELGIELRPYQLTRAANSIRRVQLYIGNILDNKFILDASHGINHIKHNIEYGYQLINIIERTRRIRRQQRVQ
jgi:hypothetical protein